MASIILPDAAAMRDFACQTANLMARKGFAHIFLYGPLGAGKTTFVSAFVSALPGGDEAEAASPSFTIYNLYPTSPLVMHCDLYRCHERIPEDIAMFLDEGEGMAIVEWAEFFPDPAIEHLDICFNVVNDKRLVDISGQGALACSLARVLSKDMAGSQAPK